MAPVVSENVVGINEAELTSLTEEGYVVLKNVLDERVCDTLRSHVLETIEYVDKVERVDLYGNIQEQDHRRDLKLDLWEPVCEALNQFAERCAPIVTAASGANDPSGVKISELASITSSPGAIDQAVHADTMHSVTRFLQSDMNSLADLLGPNLNQMNDDDDSDREEETAQANEDLSAIVNASTTGTGILFTALIALQDIDEDMGPTHVWPGTLTADHHTRLWDSRCGPKMSIAQADETFGVQHLKMTLKKGDLVLYDSRTMHCGSANNSDKRRSVMVVSTMGPGFRPDGSTYTLLHSLRNSLRLNNFPLPKSFVKPWKCESGHIKLPTPDEASERITSKNATAAKLDAVAEESEAQFEPILPLAEWEAVLPCKKCGKWRPIGVSEATKLIGDGFFCGVKGWSCLQPQGYTDEEIDEAMA